MKIGFIGTGNMASAIVKGIIKNNYVASTDIYLFDVMTEKVNFFQKKIIQMCVFQLQNLLLL